ncbi:hypothetical protein [Niallia taxi]|nr:hypothetical protein [Niallia taxi]
MNKEKAECQYCGCETNDEYDPRADVCESCFDEINLENPHGEWI